jgi:hypothetical protein
MTNELNLDEAARDVVENAVLQPGLGYLVPEYAIAALAAMLGIEPPGAPTWGVEEE